MQDAILGEVMMSRELNGADGTVITVLIGKPQPFPDGADYFCPWQIVGAGSEKVHRAGGVDSVQAVILALQMIGATLMNAEAMFGHAFASTVFDPPTFGFPVPPNLTDLLPTGRK
jgi:hypothetical protein